MWVRGIPKALVLGDPLVRLGFRREARRRLGKRTRPSDFDSKAIILAMNDPVDRVGHPPL